MASSKPRSSTAVKPKTRSRSNSFQKMLDLEKQLMMQRIQTQSSSEASSPATSHHSQQQHFTTTIDPLSKTEPISPTAPDHRRPSATAQPKSRKSPQDMQPTTTSTTHVTTKPETKSRPQSHSQPHTEPRAAAKHEPQPRAQRRGDRDDSLSLSFSFGHASVAPQIDPLLLSLPPLTFHSSSSASEGELTPFASGTPQDVGFSPDVEVFLPEDLRSTCQSPTWEAYDRRKRERKEKKEEQRVQELQAKEAKASKRRVITKPMPASASASTPSSASVDSLLRPPRASAAANHFARVSESNLNQGPPRQQRPRPLSALDLPAPAPIKDPDAVSARPRSRSSSFGALLRAPFESSSKKADHVEKGRESRFIGGVKLDHQRHSSHQSVLDSQIRPSQSSTKEELGDVHPALRNSPPNLGPDPEHVDFIKSNTQLSSAQGASTKEKRAYPPITRRPVPSRPRQQAEQPAPSTPDQSMINKWRIRMGLKAAPKKGTPVISHPHIDDAPPAYPSSTTDGFDMGIQTGVYRRPSLGRNHGYSLSSDSIAPLAMPGKPTSNPRASLPASRVDSRRMSGTGSRTSDEYKALVADVASGLEDTNLAVPPAPPRRSSKRKSFIGAYNNSSPALSTADSSPAAPSYLADFKPSSGNAKKSGEESIPRHWALNQRPQTSSSEDSFSDGFLPPSMLSTPATSRPESEKASTPDLTDCETPSYTAKLRQKAKGEEGTKQKPLTLQTRDSRTPRPWSELMTMKNQSSMGSPASNHKAHQSADSAFQDPRQKMTSSAASPPLSIQPTPTSSTINLARPAPLKIVPANIEPLAKMFVECCGCRYYHDMPSKLYEAMAKPDAAVSQSPSSAKDSGLAGLEGKVKMTVKCPWCLHEMSTRCCAGLAALVYVKERLH